MHGGMEYLERHAERKFDPEKILSGCRSLLFAAINYYQIPSKDSSAAEGKIARYAWGRDYHKTLGRRLKRIAGELSLRYPEENLDTFTDATPLAERFYAEKAGIGFTGRNTLLISSSYGSWFLMAEILSTKEFPASGSGTGRPWFLSLGLQALFKCLPTGALLPPAASMPHAAFPTSRSNARVRSRKISGRGSARGFSAAISARKSAL